MGNFILIFILVAVGVLALLRTRKHFQGGGCCGSGSNTIRSRKNLDKPAIGQICLTVEGMHCENCCARIENSLNRMEGLVCHVNLHRKTAIVSYCREISHNEVKEAVEKLGYKVTGIEFDPKNCHGRKF